MRSTKPLQGVVRQRSPLLLEGGVLSPLRYESGKAERGVVEKDTVITYFIGQALFVSLPPHTPPPRRRGQLDASA